MKNNFRKFAGLALSLGIISSTMLTGASATDNQDANTILQSHGFTIITDHQVSILGAETSSPATFDATTADGNFLFEASAFDSVMDQSAALKSMVLNGNTIAVFDNDGISQSYEETLGLHLGFEDITTDTPINNGVSVGRIYSTDSAGHLHVARVRVDSALNDTNSGFDAFVESVDKFMDSNMVSPSVISRSASMDFLGSVSDYYKGANDKGDIDVTYEVSTAQSIDNYDYYAVHAFIDATPGGALHANGYDVDAITARLSSTSSGVNLYKTGPNTMTGATEYSVDIGFTGSKDGGEVSFNAGWSRSIPDVDISKTKNSSTKCTWDVDVNDWTTPADYTISFEPGGTFRVSASNNRLSVTGYNSLLVDSATTLPSTAASGYTYFYCSADTVSE